MTSLLIPFNPRHENIQMMPFEIINNYSLKFFGGESVLKIVFCVRSQSWDNVYTETTYFCSHNLFIYISPANLNCYYYALKKHAILIGTLR